MLASLAAGIVALAGLYLVVLGVTALVVVFHLMYPGREMVKP